MTTPSLGPDRLYHPADEEEIRQLIKLAAREGKTVRVRSVGPTRGEWKLSAA